MTKPALRGGDVAFVEKENAFFVRIHSRSKNLAPVPHSGSKTLILRTTEDELEKLTPINADNTSFAEVSNALTKVKRVANAAIKNEVLLELVEVPPVTMARNVSLMVLTKNTPKPIVVLATNDLSLKALLERSVDTVNESVMNKIATAQEVISNTMQHESPKVENVQTYVPRL